MLMAVPRTSSSSKSLIGTGCAKVSENVRLSRSAASPRSSSWVSGSVGIWPGGRCGGCASNVAVASPAHAAPAHPARRTHPDTHSTSRIFGSAYQ